MKKLLSMMVCATLALSLTACSSGAKEKTPETTVEGSGEASDVEWPTGNIDIIVPLKAGGDTDFYARTYAKYLSEELGQTVTIINVEGSGGTIGAQQVKDSKADGSTLLFYQSGNLFVNKMLGVTDIDHNDFEIGAIGVLDDTNTIFAGKDSGITSAEDLVAKAKADPGSINVATTISGFSYYTVVKAMEAGEFELNPVDVGGAAAMLPAILGNQTELAANSYGVFKQYVENGDVIPLFMYGEERNPNFPDVPTAAEVGIEGAAAARAYFFAFPKGTDESIVKKFSDAVGKVQESAEFAEEIKNAYMVEPFFKDMNDAPAYLEEIWVDMSQYEDALKNN